jgi:GTP-binding protein HflX
VLVENALFATLDPTVRRAETGDGRVYTLADTVGFVRALPHQLVEAFRSTLEEVADADLILHVVDVSHPDPEGQLAAVRHVFADIPGAMDVPEIVVLNKADLAEPEAIARLRSREPGAVVVSTHTGEGIEQLRATIADQLPRPGVLVDVVVPYSRGDLVSRVHEHGDIDRQEHTADGTSLRARVDEALAAELEAAAVRPA